MSKRTSKQIAIYLPDTHWLAIQAHAHATRVPMTQVARELMSAGLEKLVADAQEKRRSKRSTADLSKQKRSCKSSSVCSS